MKIHPLRIGSTKVPYGQFYGGLQGFSFGEFVDDKDHFIRVPIHAYLIEHPTDGPVLVDTGISPEQVAHVDYYRGSIMEHVMDVDEYDLPAGETMPEQLARLPALGHPRGDRHPLPRGPRRLAEPVRACPGVSGGCGVCGAGLEDLRLDPAGVSAVDRGDHRLAAALVH